MSDEQRLYEYLEIETTVTETVKVLGNERYEKELAIEVTLSGIVTALSDEQDSNA